MTQRERQLLFPYEQGWTVNSLLSPEKPVASASIGDRGGPGGLHHDPTVLTGRQMVILAVVGLLPLVAGLADVCVFAPPLWRSFQRCESTRPGSLVSQRTRMGRRCFWLTCVVIHEQQHRLPGLRLFPHGESVGGARAFDPCSPLRGEGVVVGKEDLIMSYDALVIAAHPDDAETQMGGTLAKLSRKDSASCWLI